MIPIVFEGCNTELKKPSDMDDNQCMSLPAACAYGPDGRPYFVSAWKPNKEDVDAINRGEPIYLQLVGFERPPVVLYTKDENGECNI